MVYAILLSLAATTVQHLDQYPNYIHPVGVRSVQANVGKPHYSYRWKGLYRADPNHPQIQAVWQQGRAQFREYGLGEAAVEVYAQQVASRKIPISTRLRGAFSYRIKDHRGRVWQVMIRGDRDFHPPTAGEYSVFIGNPGG